MTDKHPGRPSEYSKDVLSDAWIYHAAHEREYGDPVPTVEGLCDMLQISKQCCYEWAKKYPEFGDALEAIKIKQGKLLQSGGLTAKFGPVITKLMLSANHGMAEKSESKQEQTGTITIVTKVPNADDRA